MPHDPVQSTPADTRGSIVVEKDAPLRKAAEGAGPQDLVSWVMGNVPMWRKDRDTKYKAKWDEYYRIWRGEWTPESKSRKSERSRLISPATQMAVDLTVAEIVEALLGRENWFDTPDDISDEQKEDAVKAAQLLREDLFKDGIVGNLIQIIQNGALYGQLMAKIVTEVKEQAEAVTMQVPDPENPGQQLPQMSRAYKKRVAIYPMPVEPGQLVFDPNGALKVDDMLGVAHEFPLGIHVIKQRQRTGVYKQAKVVGQAPTDQPTSGRDGVESGPSVGDHQFAVVTEWHGLVPRKLLALAMADANDPIARAASQHMPEWDMVEAVVTIANESILLRAIPNPSVMDDRAVICEQFDTVPNRFLGRGIVEKAFNSQKGLDAEIRARADSLAWINNPMMAGNLSKLPPRMNLNVWPGKFWGTRGPPGEALQEFRFGELNQSTFVHAQEMERMVQQATGAQDPASLRNGMRDETAVGSGIAASGMVKRAKRTMYHIEQFLNTLLRRILWRKMQFEPDRYPQDFNFLVKGTMGMMAREIEMAQSISMLQYVDKGTAPQLLILKSIFDQSSHPNKAEMSSAIDQMMKPNPEEEEKKKLVEQLQFAQAKADLNETQAKTAKLMADAGLAGAKENLTKIEAQFKDDEVLIENLRVQIAARQTVVQETQVGQKERELQLKTRQAQQTE